MIGIFVESLIIIITLKNIFIEIKIFNFIILNNSMAFINKKICS